jgi:hypothetical protein
LEGVRQLLDVLQARERCHFQDLMTGGETWVYLDMKPGTIWFPADAELTVRVKRKKLQAKAHADRFLGNSRDRTLLPAPKR